MKGRGKQPIGQGGKKKAAQGVQLKFTMYQKDADARRVALYFGPVDKTDCSIVARAFCRMKGIPFLADTVTQGNVHFSQASNTAYFTVDVAGALFP